MNQQMIGKSWLEWGNDLPNDSDSAEEEFLEYRQTVKKETPQLTIDHDIKSECGGGYVQTQLMECPMCKKVFKVCHIRDHMIRRHPDTKVKTEPPSNPSMSLPSGSKEVKVKKEYIGLNNNAMVKKRSLSNSSASSPIESVKRPKKDEERSFFFQRRENPTVIFARSDSDDASENDEDTTTHSGLNYINRIIRPLAYPRYGCYTEKNAKMHTYSSASRHLNQKLNLLQTNSIVQGLEGNEFEGSSPMTPLSQPSPKLKVVTSHVRVQH